MQPSDLGRYQKLFEHREPRPEQVPQYDKYYFKKLAEDYKSGALDSADFDIQVEKFIDASRKATTGKAITHFGKRKSL